MIADVKKEGEKMRDERLFTREEVTEIVRRRVNKLNKRIEELELELFILKELNEIDGEARARKTNFKLFKRK